jgi:hypothetical protein
MAKGYTIFIQGFYNVEIVCGMICDEIEENFPFKHIEDFEI